MEKLPPRYLMSSVVADTHALVWYLSKSNAISEIARRAIHDAIAAGDRVYISVISLIEITYLAEKRRLPPDVLTRLRDFLNSPDAGFWLVPIDKSIADTLATVPRLEIPDMPDRIIAATSLHLRLPLVTRDLAIRSSDISTIW